MTLCPQAWPMPGKRVVLAQHGDVGAVVPGTGLERGADAVRMPLGRQPGIVEHAR